MCVALTCGIAHQMSCLPLRDLDCLLQILVLNPGRNCEKQGDRWLLTRAGRKTVKQEDKSPEPRAQGNCLHFPVPQFPISLCPLPWGSQFNKHLLLAEGRTIASGGRPWSEGGSRVVLRISAFFYFGLVPAVSRKFHGSLRAEVADQAKKTKLGLSLLPVLSSLLQHEP